MVQRAQGAPTRNAEMSKLFIIGQNCSHPFSTCQICFAEFKCPATRLNQKVSSVPGISPTMRMVLEKLAQSHVWQHLLETFNWNLWGGLKGPSQPWN